MYMYMYMYIHVQVYIYMYVVGTILQGKGVRYLGEAITGFPPTRAQALATSPPPCRVHHDHGNEESGGKDTGQKHMEVASFSVPYTLNPV